MPLAALRALAFAAVFLGVLCPLSAAEQPGKAKRWSAERVLVQLRHPSSAATNSAPNYSSREWVARLGLPPGAALRSMKNGRAGVAAAGDLVETDRPMIVELNATLPVPAAVALLQQHPDVQFVEPDYIGTGAGRPGDPSYGSQWHHQKIQSEAAWDISTGSGNVAVAVLDTGLSTSAEFTGRVGSGYDYANDDAFPIDDHGHGTAVAGALAANANNGTLVAGMNWGCRILPYKVLNAQNSGFYSWWAAAIYHATDAGAKVINLSAGGQEDSATLAPRLITRSVEELSSSPSRITTERPTSPSPAGSRSASPLARQIATTRAQRSATTEPALIWSPPAATSTRSGRAAGCSTGTALRFPRRW